MSGIGHGLIGPAYFGKRRAHQARLKDSCARSTILSYALARSKRFCRPWGPLVSAAMARHSSAACRQRRIFDSKKVVDALHLIRLPRRRGRAGRLEPSGLGTATIMRTAGVSKTAVWR